MAKWKIEISHIEYYSLCVLVEADSPQEAAERVEREFRSSDYLYERTTHHPDDMETKFNTRGLAKEEDYNNILDIDAE